MHLIWRGASSCAFLETYLSKMRRWMRVNEPPSAPDCVPASHDLRTSAQALERPNVAPLRITPRTPTETAFWVEKPLAGFRLEAGLPPETKGVDRLHRHVFLIYRYRDGMEERLRLGAELFHLLMELSDGYQLGDVSTEDTFAHLSFLCSGLVREDERELLAWNPMEEDVIFRLSARIDQTPKGPFQRMVLKRLAQGGQV